MATDVEKIVLAGADDRDLTKLAEYEAVGGYEALAKARAMTPQDVTEELITSELRGRGGAFFPTGRKWSFVPSKEQIPKPHYLVVNADESEPGSFKDNEILSRVPHRFIEGCLITAHAIDSQHVFVYIRGEYSGPYEILVDALEELKDRPEIRGDVTIVVHRGAGAYICGEETALLESLEGKRGQPRSKPPFPAISGLYASPTVVNNVETITTVPPIIAMGGAEYAKLGVAELARHARRLALGQRRERRQLRDRAGHVAARHHLRPRRRDPRRARAEGGRAGRLVDGDPDEGRDRRRLRLRLARAAAHRDGLGGRSSCSTTAAASCSSASASPSSTSTSRAASARRAARARAG